jgi:predicted ATPase
VPTLVIATDAGVDTVQRSRMPPLREGLIESHGKNRNAFCHDRIQEAAYRRIPAERRARLHYQVGTLRLQTPGELTNERLFEIADHIDQALELSRDTEESSRFADAVAAGRTVLALFGLHFPSDPAGAEQAIDSAVADIRRRMAGRSIQSLAGLPEMQQTETRMSMRLLMILWPSAYISGDKSLTVLIASRMVLLSLQHGNAPESAYGYATHAITLGALMRDYPGAYEFGRLALEVNRHFDALRSRAKVNHMFSSYVGLWCRPIEDNFACSREACRAGLESGDFVYAAYGCFHESWHAMFSGMNLQRYHDEYAEKLGFLDRAGNRDTDPVGRDRYRATCPHHADTTHPGRRCTTRNPLRFQRG